MPLHITNDTLQDWQQRSQAFGTAFQSMPTESLSQWSSRSYHEWSENASVAATLVEELDDETRGLLTGRSNQTYWNFDGPVHDKNSVGESEARNDGDCGADDTLSLGRTTSSSMCPSSESSLSGSSGPPPSPEISLSSLLSPLASPFIFRPDSPTLPSTLIEYYNAPPGTINQFKVISNSLPALALHHILATTGTLAPMTLGYYCARTQLEVERMEFELFLEQARERQAREREKRAVRSELRRRGRERRKRVRGGVERVLSGVKGVVRRF